MRGEQDVSIGALTSRTCACFSLGQSNFLAMPTPPEQVDKSRSAEHTASAARLPGASPLPRTQVVADPQKPRSLQTHVQASHRVQAK